MTIRHMRILLSILRTGSMAKAAEQMHLSQPALSLAVKELEGYYGVKLFDRIGRGLRPTQEGLRMGQCAQRILELFDGMETSLRDPGAQGQVKVGASITVGNCLMPDWARRFRQAYPQARLLVRVDDSQALTQGVAEGELDLAVIEGVVSDPALTAYQVMQDRLTPVCAPDHPLAGSRRCTLEQFACQDMLTREKGSAVRALLEGACLRAGLSPRIAWQSVSTQALVQAAAQGLGIAMLPHLLAQPHLEAGRVVALKVEGLDLDRTISLIHHKNKYLGAALSAFIRIACPQDDPQVMQAAASQNKA